MSNIMCGDCSQVLDWLSYESVDLTVTSPPYGDLRAYENPVWNSSVFRLTARQLYRVTKKGGVVVWVVGDQTVDGGESGESFRQALWFMECGFRLHDTMIYMKAGPAYPSPNKYYQVFEYMFVFSKGEPKTFNPIQDRVNRWYESKWSKVRTRRQKDGELIKSTWVDEQGGKLGTRFNIWQYAVGAGNHGDEIAHRHPASFPEELAEDHILSWSQPGDLVLDPMAGSGTTLAMAKKLGRKYLGIEISQAYIDEIIIPRLESTREELRLFQDV